MNKRTINTAWRKVAALAVFITVTSLSVMAETQALRPYAYVQSHGVNRIDTGYLPKGYSRFFIDYQLAEEKSNMGIFGCESGDNLRVAFYTPGSGDHVVAYFRRASGSQDSQFTGYRDLERRILTIKRTTSSRSECDLYLYDRTNANHRERENGGTTDNATKTVSLFSLGEDSYVAGSKKIYSFEAADTTSATTPTIFLAPATNALGEAGFYDVMGNAFHGEAQDAPSTALTFSDGIGSADDYKYEGGVFSARFHAYAADDTMGGVKFGEGEAAGTSEAWVERGGSVALSAVPAAGYVFLGWTGDTWAITAGATSDETVTVASGTAVQLLAHFGEEALRWTGAAGDGNWFTPGNWKDASGNAAAALSSGDKFAFVKPGAQTVDYNPSDASFAIGSLAFGPAAGAVTVTNGEMHVAAIVVENGAENVMSNAVAFTMNIDVTATSGHVRFAGGAAGSNISNHLQFYGEYNITKTGDWIPPDGSVLKSGSRLNLLDGTYYDHNHRLTIESNATVSVKGTKIQHSSSRTLVNVNDGTFVVSGSMRFNGSSGNPTHYFASGTGGTGVLIANQIDAENGCRYCPPGHTVVGPGGIQLNGNSWIRVSNGPATHKFGAYADWEINPTVASNPAIFKNASTTSCSLIFDTSDYYDPSVQRTITVRGPIGAVNADSLSAAVTGIGTFVFAFTNENNYASTFSGGLTVRDSATASVLAGAKPGAGAVTLSDTATLEVAESGTVTLGGNLTLGESAALAFNFTERDSAPVLSIPSGSTIPETVNVKISKAADLEKIKCDAYVLTSGFDFTGKTVNFVDKPEWAQSVTVDADGNLVFEPKRTGLIIIFQ